MLQQLSNLHVLFMRAISCPFVATVLSAQVRIIAQFHADLKLIVAVSRTSVCFHCQWTQIPSIHTKLQSIILAYLVFTKFTQVQGSISRCVVQIDSQINQDAELQVLILINQNTQSVA